MSTFANSPPPLVEVTFMITREHSGSVSGLFSQYTLKIDLFLTKKFSSTHPRENVTLACYAENGPAEFKRFRLARQ